MECYPSHSIEDTLFARTLWPHYGIIFRHWKFKALSTGSEHSSNDIVQRLTRPFKTEPQEGLVAMFITESFLKKPYRLTGKRSILLTTPLEDEPRLQWVFFRTS